MLGQFSPLSVIQAHVAGLKKHTYDYDEGRKVEVDVAARLAVLGIPSAVAAAIYYLHWTVGRPEFLLAAAALLTAGFVGTFTQVADWRSTLSARRADRERSEQAVRDTLDIITGHLSAAIYLGTVLVVVLVVGANFVGSDGTMDVIPSAIAAWFGTYLVLLILLITPYLYEAYTEINDVDDALTGQSS